MQKLDLYRKMYRIRRFEERVEALFMAGQIPGFVHLYIGQEAVAVGVLAHYRPGDYLTSTHRGHGHALAVGVEPGAMMAELMGRATGICKSKGGSMHLFDYCRGMLGANGIVGGGLPIAVGAGLGLRLLRREGVVFACFGEGATGRGVFHEGLNLASLWRLPVFFVLENNGYASTTKDVEAHAFDLSSLVGAYGIPFFSVDGQNVEMVYEAAGELLARVRGGEGPAFLEARTVRFKGHYVGDPEQYRRREEVQRALDPLIQFRERLVQEGLREEVGRIEREEEQVLEKAVKDAESAPWPDPEEALEDVFAEAVQDYPWGGT